MSLKNKLASNPVRVYLYAAVFVVYGVLVAVGAVGKDDKLIEALIESLPVLLAVPAVEAARAKVTPVATTGTEELTLEPIPKDEALEFVRELEESEVVEPENPSEGA